MEVPRHSGLYRLAKRLSLGRLLRYFAFGRVICCAAAKAPFPQSY